MFCGVVACPYPIGCVLHSTTIDAERVTARHGIRVQLHTIPTERATEERALRYRAAIRDAQRELTALANESNLGPFLRAAAACDWPEVRSAASLIDIALQMDLTVEPDLSWVSGGAVPMRTHVGVPAGKL